MELRDLRAFVAAARELHFARAAAQLYMSPSSMSELIRKLELELGTSLFTRTTRQVRLTEAGTSLLERAEAILELTTKAAEAVRDIARAEVGVVRLGITPPAGPVIAPHLAHRFMACRNDVSIEIQRMWLPALSAALQAGALDVALTCGGLGTAAQSITTAEIGSEPLLIGLRPDHRLGTETSIDLQRLGEHTLGMHPAHLFPAWHAAQRQILADADLTPPIAELSDTDLTARSWTNQPEVEWIMLTGSLLTGHENTLVRAADGHAIPFTLSWAADPPPRPSVRRFIESSLKTQLPTGWLQPLTERSS